MRLVGLLAPGTSLSTASNCGDDKRRARPACIEHVVDSIRYEDVLPDAIRLPPRLKRRETYARPPRGANTVLLDAD